MKENIENMTAGSNNKHVKDSGEAKQKDKEDNRSQHDLPEVGVIA